VIETSELHERADALARAAGLGAVRSRERLSGGANNRVFRVEAVGGSALLKAYFRHPGDPRDRLAAEFAFARFAWDHGVRVIPRPLASDPAAGLGLFEFVPGRAVRPSDVDRELLAQAAAFIRDLNRHRTTPGAARLPLASEACFTLAEHLDCVRRRVARLDDISDETEIDRQARAFVRGELVPLRAAIHELTLGRAAEMGLRAEERLPEDDRIISPSDFGFHNALVDGDGRLRFLDFEYAGLDDPAKLVCDFFCQPAVPAPPSAFDRFVREAVAPLPRPGWHVARAVLLGPAYRLKWCCIMLNDFLPIGGMRRRFSAAAGKEQRLLRARAAAALLNSELTPTGAST
jgi:hypothetical protein